MSDVVVMEHILMSVSITDLKAIVDWTKDTFCVCARDVMYDGRLRYNCGNLNLESVPECVSSAVNVLYVHVFL